MLHRFYCIWKAPLSTFIFYVYVWLVKAMARLRAYAIILQSREMAQILDKQFSEEPEDNKYTITLIQSSPIYCKFGNFR